MVSKFINVIKNNIHNLPLHLNTTLVELNQKPHLIFGNKFKLYSEELKRNRRNEFIHTEKLLSVVNHAIKHVPFYSKLYNGQIISSIDQFINKINFINKDTVLENFADFKSDNIDLSFYNSLTTGGTSGKPLRLLLPKDRYITEWATMFDSFSRVGFEFDKRAVLRNTKIPEDKDFLVNPITREFLFDNFRLSDEYMSKIYYSIRKYNIKYIHAYPSAVYQFANHCYNNNLDLTFLKAFLCSSENVYSHQLEFIKNKIGTRLFSFYGHTEKLLFGAFCEETDNFHMEPSYGFFELIDEYGKQVSTPGQIGEMVGTTLNNYGMPLIRYRTGDYAEYLGNECPKCGRKTPILKKIMGRWDGDKIYNLDGSSVTTTALNLHSDIYNVIEGLQYYQEIKGELEVRIIKGKGYNNSYENLLLEGLKSKFAKNTEINIRYVDELSYGNNGKFLLLISKVNQSSDYSII